MAELKCPHCGQAFTVDDTELSSITQQIRDKEFEKDLKSRISELKAHLQEKHRLEMENLQNQLALQKEETHEKEIRQEKETHKKEIEKLREQLKKEEEKNQKLQAKLDSSEDKKTIAVMEAVKKVEDEKKDLETQLTQEKDREKILLEQKDEQIAYYKDLKTKMSKSTDLRDMTGLLSYAMIATESFCSPSGSHLVHGRDIKWKNMAIASITAVISQVLTTTMRRPGNCMRESRVWKRSIPPGKKAYIFRPDMLLAQIRYGGRHLLPWRNVQWITSGLVLSAEKLLCISARAPEQTITSKATATRRNPVSLLPLFTSIYPRLP